MVVRPTTLVESALERVWVVSGKLWYQAADGSRVPVDNEPKDDAAPAEQPNEEIHSDDDGSQAVEVVDEEDDAERDVAGAPAAIVDSPSSCSVLVRDLQGIVPLAHAGQYVALQLVRAGLYERLEGGRLGDQALATSEAQVAAADFRAHIYDVVYCVRTSTDKELTMRTLIGALARRDPVTLVEERWQYNEDVPMASKRQSLIEADIVAAFHMHRGRMATLGGLIESLPSAVQIAALIAFTPFYQWHATAYAPQTSVMQLLDQKSVNGAHVRRWSLTELEYMMRHDRIEHSEALTIAERLFFGALIGRIPLTEYDQPIGRWSGIFYNERLIGAQTKASGALNQWTRMVAQVLDLPLRGNAVVTLRNIGYVAWALYDAASALLSRDPGSTVFLLSDVLRQCNWRRKDKRFSPDAPKQYVQQACTLLCNIDVWCAAPETTVVRLASARQRAGKASDYFDEAPSDGALQIGYACARTFDVSVRLVQLIVDRTVRFCDTAGLFNEHLLCGLLDGRTVVFYCTARPTVGGGVRLISLLRLLDRERAGAAVADEMQLLVACCDTVLVHEAHMLTEVQLFRLLLLLGDATPVLLGDMAIDSPFATLARTARLYPGARRIAPVPIVRVDGHPLQRLLHQALQVPKSDRATYALVAGQLRAAERQWTLQPDAVYGRRWIIVAHTQPSTVAALQWLARSVDVPVDADDRNQGRVLRNELLKLAQQPPRLESTVLLTAPMIGYRQRCVPVARFWTVRRPRAQLDTQLSENDCIEVVGGGLTQAISLDSDALLLELAPEFHRADGTDAEDHRVCCDTWAPNVLSVSVHRPHLCSQSLPRAHDALPCDNRLFDATALLLSTDYTGSALYAAAVNATYQPRTLATVVIDSTMAAHVALPRRRLPARTCVGDLYGALLGLVE